VLALREQRNIQNAVFREESFEKNQALYVHLTFSNSFIIHDVISQRERPIRVKWMSVKLDETPVENH